MTGRSRRIFRKRCNIYLNKYTALRSHSKGDTNFRILVYVFWDEYIHGSIESRDIGFIKLKLGFWETCI